MSEATGNYMKELGMKPGGQIQENPKHTVIFNLKRNLEQCRDELTACREELTACREELIACRVNNNNLRKQIELVTSEGGRKKTRRNKKRRKSRKKRRKSRKKRRKR